MKEELKYGLKTGLERLSAWSELLDTINVFPVADGDTGRNLKISLSPLIQLSNNIENLKQKLLLAARGNSGNIASQFFIHFLQASSPEELPSAISEGRKKAWEAIHNPKQGTMLSLFDTLEKIHSENKSREYDKSFVLKIIRALENSVRSTQEQIPKLKKAHVVDSGALGMFVFFEGFFSGLINDTSILTPVTERFRDSITIDSNFKEEDHHGYCIDMVLKVDSNSQLLDSISEMGESIVMVPEEDYLKIHIHADDNKAVRKKFESMASVISWTEDDLSRQTVEFKNVKKNQLIHIITDAAGSLTQREAHKLGISLLESYITVGDRSIPETQLNSDELYRLMRQGVKASTSQSSIFERHQSYSSLLQQYNKILYLCVGSVFTGNHSIAEEWKNNLDKGNNFYLIDTGAASGRLSISAIAVSRFSETAESADEIIHFAKSSINLTDEFIFLDKLHYLAAGGRLSKTSAFFGDMLHMKPIISPRPTGAEKIGVVRNQDEQIEFALTKLKESSVFGKPMLILLQYTDNEVWVTTTVKEAIASNCREAEIIVQPLSLTTGVHTGPGTWALAYIPKQIEKYSF